MTGYFAGDQIRIPGLTASATLASAQYTPVQLASTANQVKQATATTDLVVGVVQNDPAAGEAASVAALGISKVVAGTSSITVGAHLTPNTTGVAATTKAGQKIFGIALEAPGASGDYIRALLSGLAEL